MIFGTTILVLVSIYFLWLLIMAIAWLSDSWQTAEDSDQLPVSIIIPCRNEAENISACLESIYNQLYPQHLIELIVVDDHSDDGTAQLVSNGKIKLVQLPGEVNGKKAALTYGINIASHELIITRDADTTCSKNWLQTLVNEYNKTQPDMLITPVTLKEEGTFINLFERLEYYAFTIITGGTAALKKPILCNGANLLFKKSTFFKVNGYEGNEKTASGDDVFLLNKIAVLPGSIIRYVKDYEATVFTGSAATIDGFLHQRLRWAGKNTRNTNLWSAFTGLLVFFTNVSWLLMAVLSVFSCQWASYLLIITVLKCIIDFLLLFLGSTFHKQRRALIGFPLMVLLYPFYIAIIAILSVVVQPKWKGRNIN